MGGNHIIVTAGATHSAIDPLGHLPNRSSRLQGLAVAGAPAGPGARVTLIAGPGTPDTPPGETRGGV